MEPSHIFDDGYFAIDPGWHASPGLVGVDAVDTQLKARPFPRPCPQKLQAREGEAAPKCSLAPKKHLEIEGDHRLGPLSKNGNP